MLNFKVPTIICAVGCATLLLGTVSAIGPATSQTQWDYATPYPDTNFHTVNARKFAAEIENITDGQIRVNIHSGGGLGMRGPEMLAAVRDGIITMGDLPINLQVGEAPLLNLQTQHFLFGDLDEYRIFWDEFKPAVAQIAEDFNQKLMYVVPWPQTLLYTKKPIESLSDLQGTKIRVSDPVTFDVFNALNVPAVLLPWGEAVPALASGVVDAAETSAASGVDGQFWEFMTHLYQLNNRWNTQMVTINRDAWDALSPEHQKAIEEAADRFEVEFWATAAQEGHDKKAILLQNGMIEGEISEAMISEMQRLSAPIFEANLEEMGDEAKTIYQNYLVKVGRAN